MRDKFKNKNGDLTHYALACGYLQQFKHSKNECELVLTLWHEGGPCFHVRLNSYDSIEGSTRHFWQVFDDLTGARKYWHRTKNNILELSKMQ